MRYGMYYGGSVRIGSQYQAKQYPYRTAGTTRWTSAAKFLWRRWAAFRDWGQSRRDKEGGCTKTRPGLAVRLRERRYSALSAAAAASCKRSSDRVAVRYGTVCFWGRCRLACESSVSEVLCGISEHHLHTLRGGDRS